MTESERIKYENRGGKEEENKKILRKAGCCCWLNKGDDKALQTHQRQ